jgi:hypothetical protein
MSLPPCDGHRHASRVFLSQNQGIQSRCAATHAAHLKALTTGTNFRPVRNQTFVEVGAVGIPYASVRRRPGHTPAAR